MVPKVFEPLKFHCIFVLYNNSEFKRIFDRANRSPAGELRLLQRLSVVCAVESASFFNAVVNLDSHVCYFDLLMG